MPHALFDIYDCTAQLFEQVVDFVRRVYGEESMGGYCSDHSSVYFHAHWTRNENQQFAQELNMKALQKSTFAYLIAEPVELLVPADSSAFAMYRDYQIPPPRLYGPKPIKELLEDQKLLPSNPPSDAAAAAAAESTKLALQKPN